MLKSRVLIVGIFIITFVIGIGVVRQNKSAPGFISENISKSNGFLSPTPVPFSEMTIPALRARSYESKIGELKLYQDNRTYKAYTTYYDSDGLKVNGLLTIPKPPKPEGGYPAIVFVHGYIAPTIYRTTEKYVEYVDNLARNGFVVFKIDLRGHGSSEGDAGGGYYSGDYVVDTLNAYAALQSFDQVNSNKIGIWGHSMAGNVTARAWAARPEIPAVVVWAGAGYTYTDLQDYRIQDNSYRPPDESSAPRRKRDELFKTYGQFDPNSEFWKQVPATNYLADLKGAIEIHHAVDDTVVSIDYSRNLMKLLDKTQVPHKLYEYPNGGHNISGSSFNQAMGRTAEFFKKQLK